MKTLDYYLKRIICLSKSRKTGGFCFAGKEISEDNVVGDWVRPVSAKESEEISSSECEYQDGCMPNLLDIIEVPVLKSNPVYHQRENYLINDGYYWSKEGTIHKKSLKQLCDFPESLWKPHDSSYYGINDRVHNASIRKLVNSIYFITPSSLVVVVQTEGKEFGNPKKKIRALFEYNGESYLFPVTDPNIESIYLEKDDGEYVFKQPKNKVFLCVSIGLPWKGYCYKFVASIIK